MSKIRNIKPDFWASEQIVSCSLNARLMFVGMWNFCDDNGIHPASCVRLKAQIFPCDEICLQEINNLIMELLKNDLISEYEHEYKKYWIVKGFIEHQRFNHAYYKYPPPLDHKNDRYDAWCVSQCTRSVHVGTVQDPRVTLVGKGRVGKGKESKVNNNNIPLTPKTEKPGCGEIDIFAGLTFQKFIEAYPKKVGQRKMNEAANIWKSQGMEQHGGMISKSIRDRIAFSDWREKIGTDQQKFIPGPVAFLQDRLFEKEFERVLSFEENLEQEKKQIEEDYKNGKFS